MLFAILMEYRRMENIMYQEVEGDNSGSIRVGIYEDKSVCVYLMISTAFQVDFH